MTSARSEAIFVRVADVIRQTFSLAPDHPVVRTTTSADVDGWDSLSYTMLIMEIEAAFGIQLPFDRVFDLTDVGELADIVDAARQTTA